MGQVRLRAMEPYFIYSQRGRRMAVWDGFKFYKVHPTSEGSLWRCSVKTCCSKIYMDPGDARILKAAPEHNHPPCSKLARQQLSNSIKKIAAEQRPGEPAAAVLRREIGDRSLGLSHVDLARIKRNIYHARRKTRLLRTKDFDPDLLPLRLLQVPQGGVGQQPPPQQVASPGPAAPSVPKKAPPPPAAPPEVCLRWNSYHSNMQATFPSLLNNEQFVDVTLACEGRSIKCHKVMLSACSSYFEELLSQNPCQHPIIFMRDLKFWEVQALVEFMYTGEVNVAQDKLPSLLTAAEALQIKGLTNPGSTGGGSFNASSHEEDSNTAADVDETSSQSYPPPQKRVRKRKSTNPTSYHQKTQVFSGGAQGSPIGSPSLPATPPALNPMRIVQQHSVGLVQQMGRAVLGSPRPKKELDSPPHLPPPHVPSPYLAIKTEPDDSCDTLLDLSETDRKEPLPLTLPPSNHDHVSIEPGTSSNGSVAKIGQDNGLSEEDEHTGSDCSDPQSMHIDPGEPLDI